MGLRGLLDNSAENHKVWRATFKGMVQAIEITANEELALVKWLDTKSSNCA